MKILVVEDEKRLAEALCQILMEEKYMVDTVADGAEGLHYAAGGSYDAVILDVMLPLMNGFEVVKKLRESKISTPVLMLTAKDEIYDKVHGLDCGADDYMTKPFSPDELLARLRALLRRQGEIILDELAYSDLTLSISTNTLHCGAKSVHLGFKEFEILRILMTYPNMITPKEDLISKVWGAESGAEDNNVEAYISFLRKKFFFLRSKVGVQTIRKVGYRLEESE